MSVSFKLGGGLLKVGHTLWSLCMHLLTLSVLSTPLTRVPVEAAAHSDGSHS